MSIRELMWECPNCQTTNAGKSDVIEGYYQICHKCKSHVDVQLEVDVRVASVTLRNQI